MPCVQHFGSDAGIEMEQKLKTMPPRRPAAISGFTLIELLVVLSIMVVVVAFVAPSFTGLVSSSRLTQTGDQIHDQLMLARQEAVTKNREVQAIFMRLRDRTGSVEWRALQLWGVVETFNGPSAAPLGKISIFDPPYVISDDITLSPLLTVEPFVAGADPVNNPTADDVINGLLVQSVAKNGYVLEGWARARMRANGSVDSQVTSTKNFITVCSSRDQGSPPANYATIQINPTTGKVTTYRP